MVNAWRLSRKSNPHLRLSEFYKNLVIAVLKTYEVEKCPGAKYPSESAEESVRFNRGDHWTARGEHSRSRCKECNGRTPHICKICKVPLHPVLTLCYLSSCSKYSILEISYRSQAARDIARYQLTAAHGYNCQTLYCSTAN